MKILSLIKWNPFEAKHDKKSQRITCSCIRMAKLTHSPSTRDWKTRNITHTTQGGLVRSLASYGTSRPCRSSEFWAPRREEEAGPDPSVSSRIPLLQLRWLNSFFLSVLGDSVVLCRGSQNGDYQYSKCNRHNRSSRMRFAEVFWFSESDTPNELNFWVQAVRDREWYKPEGKMQSFEKENHTSAHVMYLFKKRENGMPVFNRIRHRNKTLNAPFLTRFYLEFWSIFMVSLAVLMKN